MGQGPGPRWAGSEPRWALRELLIVEALLALLLLAVSSRYGPHRDELYFVSAGERLAWGYLDQPSWTPLLARAATVVAPHNLVILRIAPLMGVCLLVLCAVDFARLLGGHRPGQVLTATTVAASALVLAVGHRLNTAVFDTLAWTAILLVASHALVQNRPRLWLLAGVLAGIGLNNKHAVVFVLFGLFVGVVAVRETRSVLRSVYPWLAAGLALLLWLPNLVWQARSGWPVFALSADIAGEYGGLAGRLGLLGQALVMFSPLIAVVWIYGLVALLRQPGWVRVRPVGIAFVVVSVVFLISGGKGYYLAGVIVPLLAAGCTALARRWPPRRLVVTGTVLALSALVAWPAMIPVLPAGTYASSFYPSIDADQLETLGWPEFVESVRSVLADLPAASRSTAVIFTQNYGEAGALEWYEIGRPVYSGHNGWANWGPPPEGATPVLVVTERDPGTDFDGCRQRGVVQNASGARNEELGAGIYLCAGPKGGSWRQAWPRLSHLTA